MIRQFRRFDFYEIGFHVLDNSITNASGQKIGQSRNEFGRRGEGPAFLPASVDDLCDLIGELFVNAAVGFVPEFTFGDRGLTTMRTGGLGNGEKSGLIGHFVEQSAVGAVISNAWINFRLGPRVGVSLT